MEKEFIVSESGVLALRNAIIQQACEDYIKAKVYIEKHKNIVVPEKTPYISVAAWHGIQQDYKRGRITKEEFEEAKQNKWFSDIKHRMCHYESDVKQITKWFNSKGYYDLEFGPSGNEIINALDSRVEEIINSKSKKNYRHKTKHCGSIRKGMFIDKRKKA